jgi:glycosyltransferase involved in cell wall biosynthesis
MVSLKSIPAMYRWYRGAPRRLVASARYAAMAKAAIEPNSVAVWGHLQSEIGLGWSARSMVETLRRFIPDLNCHNIPKPGRNHVNFTCPRPRALSQTNIFVTTPIEFLDGHDYFPHQLLRGTKRIGQWYWELSRTPDYWTRAIDLVDEIWAGSVFCAEAFQNSTTKGVHVIPPLVADWTHRPTKEARRAFPNLPPEAYVFMAIFDFASGTRRKNPQGMIAAFTAAFPPIDRDRPYLVLKYHGTKYDLRAAADIEKSAAKDPHIILMDGVFPDDKLYDLKDACDCYVSLHRAEGFGLNIAEAMLAEKPVICTGYSGNLDFTNEQNSFLVSYRLTKLNPGDYYHSEGQEWAEPDFDDAVSDMQLVYQNREQAENRARAGRQTILDKYSLAAAANAAQAVLRR